MKTSRKIFSASICFALAGALLYASEPKAHAVVGATTPFVSYEAEAGTVGGGAKVVTMTSLPTNQFSSPLLEASGHAYVQLTATGQFVRWKNGTGKKITAINVRYCIPDSRNGGGFDATLDLYVNGIFRQAIKVTSRQTWLYEGNNHYQDNDQNPADGEPRVFFDDVHTFIKGGSDCSWFDYRTGKGHDEYVSLLPDRCCRRRGSSSAHRTAGELAVHYQLWRRGEQQVGGQPWANPELHQCRADAGQERLVSARDVLS